MQREHTVRIHYFTMLQISSQI